MRYDIAVIGNDEAAFELLCLAAESGKRTIALLPESRHSSWMLGQALRRLVSNLLVDRSVRRRQLLNRAGSPRLLQKLVAGSIAAEVADHVHMLEHLGVEVVLGACRFLSPRELVVSSGMTCTRRAIHATNTVIATGVRQTALHRPLGLMPFHSPESLFEGTVLPDALCTFGGGDVGAGLAALFSLFGTDARHIASPDHSSAMLELAHESGVRMARQPDDLLKPITSASLPDAGSGVVDCRHNVGFTEHLNLAAIGVEPDEHGQLWCGSQFETWCSNVYGIGDVVGFATDHALSPTAQAVRVMNRMTHSIPRPYLLDSFVRAGVAV